MFTLKKLTKMGDDAMIIRVSVKTTRMHANDFNAPNKQLSKQWHLNFFYFDF